MSDILSGFRTRILSTIQGGIAIYVCPDHIRHTISDIFHFAMSTIITEHGAIHTPIIPSSLSKSALEGPLRELHKGGRLFGGVNLTREDVSDIVSESIRPMEDMAGVPLDSKSQDLRLWYRLPGVITAEHSVAPSTFEGEYHRGECNSATCTVKTTPSTFSVQVHLHKDLAETDISWIAKRHTALLEKKNRRGISTFFTGLKSRKEVEEEISDERTWVEIQPELRYFQRPSQQTSYEFLATQMDFYRLASRLEEQFPLYMSDPTPDTASSTLKLGEEYLLDVLCAYTEQPGIKIRHTNVGIRVPITVTFTHQEDPSVASANDF